MIALIAALVACLCVYWIVKTPKVGQSDEKHEPSKKKKTKCNHKPKQVKRERVKIAPLPGVSREMDERREHKACEMMAEEPARFRQDKDLKDDWNFYKEFPHLQKK